MRIVVLTTSFPSHAGDPAGHFVATEARRLADRGHAVTVLAPAPAGPLDDVRVVALPAGDAFGWPGVAMRLRERPWRVLGAARFVAGARRALVALAQDEGVDHVVAHWALPMAWPVAQGLPSVHAVSHGADVRLLSALPVRVRDHVCSTLARDVATWRFVSTTLRDRLLDGLSRPVAADVQAKSYVEASPVELEGVARRLERDAFPGPTYVVVGRLVPSKRVGTALRHVARKHQEDEVRPRVIVVGDGPERPRLEDLARRCDLDARFVGLVPRGEALGWIAAADALLFAARPEDEGEPTVLREARHFGTPIEWVA